MRPVCGSISIPAGRPIALYEAPAGVALTCTLTGLPTAYDGYEGSVDETLTVTLDGAGLVVVVVGAVVVVVDLTVFVTGVQTVSTVVVPLVELLARPTAIAARGPSTAIVRAAAAKVAVERVCGVFERVQARRRSVFSIPCLTVAKNRRGLRKLRCPLLRKPDCACSP
jgi:hypothetical protein